MTDGPPRCDSPERSRRGHPVGVRCPRRLVTVLLPSSCFVIVLLFPFYWMAITALKSNEELYNYKDYNPFWVHSPTLGQHQASCCSRPTIRAG